MMTPSDMHMALMIHTVESIDRDGQLIPLQARREADELLEGDTVGTPSEALSARSRALGNYLAIRSPALLKVSDQLNTLGTSLIWSALALSLCLGFSAHSFGEGQHFHLLSPVLLTMIIWNVVSMGVMTLSLRSAKSTQAESHASRSVHLNLRAKVTHLKSPALERIFRLLQPILIWLQLRSNALISIGGESSQLQRQVLRLYLARLWDLTQAQVLSELRRTLHFMAIAFVCGVLLSAYWDGLIHEYRATVESTFLSVDMMESLLSLILAPSSLLGFGEVSLAALKPTAPHGILLGEAAPWIHRYAISLLIWVIMPRLFFALTETFRCWRAVKETPYVLRSFEQVPTLNIGLASHTNIGKTSLARTLLRRDIGTVRDAEHVTQSRSCYFLINQPSIRVRLWDTPGFGNLLEQPFSEVSTTLESRLETEAFEALRDEADLILYLVSAWPNEGELGRSIKEVRLLASLGRPIILVINRLYDSRRGLAEQRASLDIKAIKEKANGLWSDALGEEISRGAIHSIIILDAFEKPLSDERALYSAIHNAVPTELKSLTRSALEEWERERAEQVSRLALSIERCVGKLIRLDETVTARGKKGRQSSVERLNQRSEEVINDTLERILDQLGLVGELRSEVFASTMAVTFLKADHSAKRKWGAIWGGAVSGLTTGVVADLMSGGLSLGSGLIVGTVLGAIGGAGLVEGYEYITDGDQRVTLSADSVMNLLEKLCLFTLDASAHGRARGEYAGLQLDLEESGIDELQERCAQVISKLFELYSDSLRESICLARAQRTALSFHEHDPDKQELNEQPNREESRSTLTLLLKEGLERI